jgi:hypothetical protein
MIVKFIGKVVYFFFLLFFAGAVPLEPPHQSPLRGRGDDTRGKGPISRAVP